MPMPCGSVAGQLCGYQFVCCGWSVCSLSMKVAEYEVGCIRGKCTWCRPLQCTHLSHDCSTVLNFTIIIVTYVLLCLFSMYWYSSGVYLLNELQCKTKVLIYYSISYCIRMYGNYMLMLNFVYLYT